MRLHYVVALSLLLSACTGYQRLPPSAIAADDTAVDPPLPPAICDRVVDDFTQTQLGGFPEGWETPDSDDLPIARSSGSFRVEQVDGQRALHARYQGKELTLGHGIHDWDLERYPIVRWRWKAVQLPRADADSEFDEDAAASVQAVWMIGMPFFVRTMRYTWSSTLAAGTRAEARLGHDQLIVLRSGLRGAGRWHTEQINVLEHYRSFFGLHDASAPTGLALRTDADDTKSQAEAYYADFRLCRPVP